MIHIVLYEPEIPQNTGNIMRTCMAFGMRLHLIEPLGFSLDDKHLKRAGMDYIDEVFWTIYPDWKAFAEVNHGSMYFLTRYGFHTPSECNFKGDIDKGEDIYLVFGKESTGIDKAILKEHLDRCIRIPMVPHARSLNLSNCVAILAYEAIAATEFAGLSDREVQKGADFLLHYDKANQ